MKLKTIFKMKYWEQHPQKAFYVMSIVVVLCVLISTAVSVIQITNNSKQEVSGFTREVKDGFAVFKDDLSQGSTHLNQYRQCKRLESQIDSLMSKDTLSLADSVRIERILSELELMYQELNNE
ncbi:MAG: hypothetical protein ACK5M7_09235 [Draconibacterium sp.]